MSHYTTENFGDYDSGNHISIGTEDSNESQSLCSNDSYESRFIDDDNNSKYPDEHYDFEEYYDGDSEGEGNV